MPPINAEIAPSDPSPQASNLRTASCVSQSQGYVQLTVNGEELSAYPEESTTCQEIEDYTYQETTGKVFVEVSDVDDKLVFIGITQNLVNAGHPTDYSGERKAWIEYWVDCMQVCTGDQCAEVCIAVATTLWLFGA